MKLYKFETYISAEDNLSKKDILSALDRWFNRGDGYYIYVGGEEKIKGIVLNKPNLSLIAEVKEKD